MKKDIKRRTKPNKQMAVKASLFFYDVIVFTIVDLLIFVLYKGQSVMSVKNILIQSGLAFDCIFLVRCLSQIYRQIWRYGGIQCYIRLLLSDTIALAFYFAVEMVLPIEKRLSKKYW